MFSRTLVASFACLAAFSLSAGIVSAQAPAAEKSDPKNVPQNDRCLVMISIDGLAGFYFDDPKAEMPHIRALAAQGARAKGMEVVAPSVTWPNHTTLVTGDFPARHGVVGNTYLDRDTLKKVALNPDPTLDKTEIVKVPTIYDVAKQAGLTTAAIRWPATRNAPTLDWTTPDCGKDALVLKYTTPALLKECVDAKIIPAPTPEELAATPDSDSKKDGFKRFDEPTSVAAFKMILQKHRPGLALLHIAETDHMQHLKGPRSPEAYAAIKNADEEVGQVWDELQRDFGDNATLVIVSDHGFSKIEHQIYPNIILSNAGLITIKGIRVVAGSVRAVQQGGSAFIYILDAKNRDQIAAQVTKAFTGVKGVTKILQPGELATYGIASPAADPHAPDMVLFADDGYTFGDTAAGTMPFSDKPEVLGTHGHDPHLPNLQATFVAVGRGIKPGVTLGVIPNRDVAPTLAALLNVKMPDTDGKALTEILSANDSK